MKLRFLLAICLAASAAAQTTADNVKPAPPVAPSAVAPSAVNEPLLSARALMKKGQLKDAAAAFKALVEKDPTLADAHAGLIRCLLKSNQLDDADFAGTRALAALPSSALVHASVGDVAFRAGNFGDAEKEYRAALKIDTNSARAVFGMGRMLHMVSMNKRAKENYARAHQVDPEDGEITRYWLETLTYAERLEQDKKTEGDPDNKANMRRYLTAVAEKKPWLMVNEIKPMEIKMPLYGRNLAGVQDISRSGPKAIYEGYGLQVRFNDRSSAMLLVDTGAGGIVIGRRLAERIGAVKIADTRIFGIGDQGPVESYVASVDKINIGALEFHNCVVIVSSKNDVADDAGLIGPNVFDKFLVTLDFHNQRMVLEPLPPNPSGASVDEEWQDRYIAPQMQGFTKFYRFGHDIVVPVLVNDKATGNFILDTGAGINSMSPKFALQVTKAEADGEYRMKGVSGRVSQVLTGQKAILQFAKMRIESHDLPVFAADNISASDGTEIAGFVGIRVLAQMKMTIDYRDGLVNLEVYEFKKARE
ncbi:MAG TPA: aspartyl protease family protein [Candidatus Polarisedimenticolia bacterium]|nr:aspartyl protease family protein [Candidatus Polarisedimenticolia bacterium]